MLVQIKEWLSVLKNDVAQLEQEIQKAENSGLVPPLLGSVFDGAPSSSEPPRPEQPANVTQLPETKPCPACAATGLDSRSTGEKEIVCEHCNGSAVVKTEPAPATA